MDGNMFAGVIPALICIGIVIGLVLAGLGWLLFHFVHISFGA